MNAELKRSVAVVGIPAIIMVRYYHSSPTAHIVDYFITLLFSVQS